MISKILAHLGDSKTGQKFFNWASQPKSESFLNNTLPTIETAFSTACYMYSTAKQKNIDSDRKKMLQIQHVASGVAGMTIGSIANRAISKTVENVIPHLDPKKIDPESLKQVSTGLRIIAPLICTTAIMRLVTPTIIALFSGKAMDKVRDNRGKKSVGMGSSVRDDYTKHLKHLNDINKQQNKLDIKA